MKHSIIITAEAFREATGASAPTIRRWVNDGHIGIIKKGRIIIGIMCDPAGECTTNRWNPKIEDIPHEAILSQGEYAMSFPRLSLDIPTAFSRLSLDFPTTFLRLSSSI